MIILIKLIKKHWGLLIDILLVIGVILVFTFWDPFGLFTKTKIRATANMVSSIKDIGQLVTAEYYGEVLSSLKEFKLTEFSKDSISPIARNLYVDLKFEYSSKGLTKNLIKKSMLKKDYGADFYYKFIAFLGTQYSGGNDFEDYYKVKKGELKKGVETDVLRQLRHEIRMKEKNLKKEYGDDSPEYTEELNFYIEEIPDEINDFYKFSQEILKKDLFIGSNRNKSIVFIGRGWVKAGFDFGTISDQNLLYDEKRKVIHLHGIHPSILDTDINPWFIPERKVKGFELVDYSGKVTFEDAKVVKNLCKQKLLSQALLADILLRAQVNGKEALTNFFSLLLSEPNLKVQFHTQPYNSYFNIITADTLISFREAIFLDSLVKKELLRISFLEEPMDTIQIMQLEFFIKQLKSLPFHNQNYPFSYYSILAARILKDTFHISNSDLDELLTTRNQLSIDKYDNTKVTTPFVSANSIWFRDSFRTDFNKTIKFINDHFISMEGVDTIKREKIINKSDTAILEYVKITKTVSVLISTEYQKIAVKSEDTSTICYVFKPSRSTNDDSTIRYISKLSIDAGAFILDDLKYSQTDLIQRSDSLQSRFAANDSLFESDYNHTVYNIDLRKRYFEDDSVTYQALKNRLEYERKIRPLHRLVSATRDIMDNSKTK